MQKYNLFGYRESKFFEKSMETGEGKIRISKNGRICKFCGFSIVFYKKMFYLCLAKTVFFRRRTVTFAWVQAKSVGG